MDEAFQLLMQDGPEPGRIFPLLGDEITLGRSPLSGIIIDDPEVSRQHARLLQTGGGYAIQDAGSTNGTFVNGRRLSGEPSALKRGQIITIGSNVALVYQTSEGNELVEALSDQPIVAGSGRPTLAELDEPDEDLETPEERLAVGEPPIRARPAPEPRVADFSAERRPLSQEPFPPPPPEQPNRNRTLIIVAVVAAILLLLCCCAIVLAVLYFIPVEQGISPPVIGATINLLF